MYHHQEDNNDLIQDVKDLVAFFSIILGLTLVATLASCTSQQRAQVKTVLEAADQGAQPGCILFEQLKIDQEHVEDICLASAEVREAVADFKRKKAERQAAASASAALPPAPSASAAPSPAGSAQ